MVTNGHELRLLRDSSRLVNLTYLEFDLDRMFTDGLFADFAVMFRLLHASRLPFTPETAAESHIERYHQDSLDSGARIRDGLSRAVKKAILSFANGFLGHPANDELRQNAEFGRLSPKDYYQHLLRLIYRILFLLVIEERNLVYPLSPGAAKRDLYYRYYSLQRLRRLSEKRFLADRRRDDLWLSLRSCFALFEAGGPGHKLGIAPLAGDLFDARAIVRTGEEQPSPAAFRAAVRDVIRECIYGVDINPLAVELCKVALWLEAHVPGQPLNFLDHHIKCGNAIVGFVRRDELERGVPDESFSAMPEDDKDVLREYRKRNKEERRPHKQIRLELSPEIQKQLGDILLGWREVSVLPERNPEEIEAKKNRYLAFIQGKDAWLLNQIACIPIAQFFLLKTPENRKKLITDAEFRQYLTGERHPQGQATSAAWAMSTQKRFFHWFLEFPEIIESGGFDCILGNPPYLGGQSLSGTYGHAFCQYVKWEYAPAGLSDLVAYFVRRIYRLLRPDGFSAFITTNSIKDGDVRKDGLEQVIAQDGAINFAVRGIKWPGLANLVVSLVSIHKGQWTGRCVLDGRSVPVISAFLEDTIDAGEPIPLLENANRMFQGSIFLGDGFLLSHEKADRLIKDDPRNQEVIFPVINGQEINNYPEQTPGRSIINFFDWDIEESQEYKHPFHIVEQDVKPERMRQKDKGGQEYWWRFLRPRNELYASLGSLHHCFVAARTTKHLNFSALPTNFVFTDALYVFTTDRWDHYTIVQSTIHEVWARKFSGTLKQDLRYSPSKCFETFPFPEGLWRTPNTALAAIGEHYHEHRRELMRRLWLGLTGIYNLFHARDLTTALVAKVSRKPEEAEAGYHAILELRALHRELDAAILAAYGWTDLALGHGFVEIETLPKNDRVRYTISPDARKEVLCRLLALNHQRAAADKATVPAKPQKRRNKEAIPGKPGIPKQIGLI